MTCNDTGKEIWGFCIQKRVHLSAARIPGIHSVTYDEVSRELFSTTMFTRIFELPKIDMFASRLNKQLDQYASCMPDPKLGHS